MRLPQITTAAVTTTADGNVHDVFRVRVDPNSAATPADIQGTVAAMLQNEAAGDKRRRRSLGDRTEAL